MGAGGGGGANAGPVGSRAAGGGIARPTHARPATMAATTTPMAFGTATPSGRGSVVTGVDMLVRIGNSWIRIPQRLPEGADMRIHC